MAAGSSEITLKEMVQREEEEVKCEKYNDEVRTVRNIFLILSALILREKKNSSLSLLFLSSTSHSKEKHNQK